MTKITIDIDDRLYKKSKVYGKTIGFNKEDYTEDLVNALLLEFFDITLKRNKSKTKKSL